MSKKAVSVYLNEKELEILKKEVAETGFSLSLVVRRIVREWILDRKGEAVTSEG